MTESSDTSPEKLAQEINELDAKIAELNVVDPLQPLLEQFGSLRNELNVVESKLSQLQYSNYRPSIDGVRAELHAVESLHREAPRRIEQLRMGVERLELVFTHSYESIARLDDEVDALRDFENEHSRKCACFERRLEKLKADQRPLEDRRDKLKRQIEQIQNNIAKARKNMEVDNAP